MKRSKEVKLVLLTASVAALLAGCDGERFPTLGDCEKANGAGNCTQPPSPVGMTAANRPEYTKLDKCEADFGEEKCSREMGRHGGAVFRPVYVPGKTYFYPYGSPHGYFGYYGGRPDLQYTNTAAARPFVNKTGSLGKTHVVTRGVFTSFKGKGIRTTGSVRVGGFRGGGA